MTDYATLKKWEYLNSTTGEDSAFIGFRRDKLAEAVRKYHIPDFSNWKNPAAFDPPTLRFGATGLHLVGDDVRSL